MRKVFFISIFILFGSLTYGQIVQLVSPNNNAQYQATRNLNLFWRSIPGAQFYSFELATSATFTQQSIVVERDVIDTTTIVNNLSNNTVYFWRVRVYPGDGEWSDVWSFTTTGQPVIPTLISPENESINVDSPLDLVWSSHIINKSFRLEIALDSEFNQIAVGKALEDTTFEVTQLVANKLYYWRVKSYNIDAAGSDWSDVFSFKTGLNPPVLLLPEDESDDNLIELTFSWGSVAGASEYRFQLAGDTLFTTVLIEATTNQRSYFVDELTYDTQYFWRVSAYNEFGDSSAYSDFFSLRTNSGSPFLISPANNSIDIPLDIQCSWSAVTGAKQYKFQISLDSLFVEIFDQNVTRKTDYTVKDLYFDTTYYWKVLTYFNSGDSSQWSNFNTFTTVDGIPELLLPDDEEEDIPGETTFTWGSVEGASNYVFQIAYDEFFTDLYNELDTEETFIFVPDLKFDTTYYWRVSCYTDYGDSSGWSDFHSFTTIAGIPELIYPENRSRNLPIEFEFLWNRIPGASSYKHQISADSLFNQIVRETITNDSVQFVENLLFDSTYYWRVAALNEGGSSKWSDHFWFDTTPGLIVEPYEFLDTLNFSAKDSDTLKTIYYSNLGVRELNYDQIYAEPDSIFLINKNQINLQPGATDSIYVVVDTTKIDSVVEYGTLSLIRIVSENEIDTLTTPISVLFQRAVAEFSDTLFWFDTVRSASKKNLEFFIKCVEENTDLNIDSIRFGGRDPEAFNVVSFSKQTPVGDSSKITIEFFPARLDTNRAVMEIYTNSYPQFNYEFDVAGIGKGGEISKSSIDRLEEISSLDFETFENNFLDFFIKNVGSDQISVSFSFIEKYFEVFEEEKANIIIEPYDSLSFPIVYLTPNFGLENVDTMKIWHNGFGESPINVVLNGTFNEVNSTNLLKNNLKVNNSHFVEEAYIFPEQTSIQYFLEPELLKNLDNLEFKIHYYKGGPGSRRSAIDAGDQRFIIPYNEVSDLGLLFYGQLVTKNNFGRIEDSVDVFNLIDGQVIVDNYTSTKIYVPRSTLADNENESDVRWTFFGFPFGDVVFDSLFWKFGGRENMKDGEWIVYNFNPSLSNSYTPFDSYYIPPNKGYFIAQTFDSEYYISHTYKNSFLSRKLTDTLFTPEGEGWKTISTPFTFPVEVDTPVTLLKWDTNNKSFRMTSIMRPGEAYFIDGSVSEIKMKTYGEYYPDLFPKILAGEPSSLKLKIKGNEIENEVYLSYRKNTFENNKLVKKINSAPPIQKGLKAFLVEDDQEKQVASIKSGKDGAIWNLILLNDQKDDQVNIETTLKGILPDGIEIVIYDPSERIEIINTDQISLQKSISKKFKIIAGNEEFIQKSIEEINAQNPLEFKLYDNYPNPFNPSTTIKFSIQQQGFVSLKIFDILGREVTTLLSEDKEPGIYEIIFDTKNINVSLASGIYFYRLQSNETVLVKKLMLLK